MEETRAIILDEIANQKVDDGLRYFRWQRLCYLQVGRRDESGTLGQRSLRSKHPYQNGLALGRDVGCSGSADVYDGRRHDVSVIRDYED